MLLISLGIILFRKLYLTSLFLKSTEEECAGARGGQEEPVPSQARLGRLRECATEVESERGDCTVGSNRHSDLDQFGYTEPGLLAGEGEEGRRRSCRHRGSGGPGGPEESGINY